MELLRLVVTAVFVVWLGGTLWAAVKTTRRIVGWAAAAERVGLQPSDLRARAARGMFPEREDEERAARGPRRRS